MVSLAFNGCVACAWAEGSGNPNLPRLGVDQVASNLQPGGNMEGKEMRFGIADSALLVAVTTAATTGSVNTMHDSLTPLGGAVPLAQMMLNCVFGGDGVGFINLMQYAIALVAMAGEVLLFAHIFYEAILSGVLGWLDRGKKLLAP